MFSQRKLAAAKWVRCDSNHKVTKNGKGFTTTIRSNLR